MITLHDYQQDLLEKSQTALAPEGARVMTQLPTGGGKTEIAGALLKDFLVDGRKAVWLTHREELADQTENRLKRNWLIPAQHLTDRWRQGRPAPDMPNGASILKAQTVSRRNKDSEAVWDNYGPDDLLVIDEAHHAPASGWERAIEQWPGRVWGLTATPWRLELEKGFDHLFHKLIAGPQISELQAGSHLAPSSVWAPTTKENWIVGKETRLGEYTPVGIERDNDKAIMTNMAVDSWRDKAVGRQTVVYAVSKGHADNLVEAFEERGISTKAILSNTSPDDREKAIEDFEDGNITVLVNVAVVTEGFDLPDASCVMMTRPTKSLALYLQMVGRGLRRKDDGGNCLILDLAGNSEEHGLPEMEREWSLAARGNPAAGDPPGRHCHKCGNMEHPSRHNCRECGADLGKPCQRCGWFRPWSRWTVECPVEHEAVCDRCHDDIHSKLGIGRFDRNSDSLSYAKRAEEFHKEGNLEAALADCFLAIHVAKTDSPEINLPILYCERAKLHYDMGNFGLAEGDFSAAEDLYAGGAKWFTTGLIYMHQERAKMYEELGYHGKAELDRQKAKELNDKIAARSNSDQD